MELIPIKETREENSEFVKNPLLRENILVCLDFYQKVGYNPPWICFYVREKKQYMASAGFKGRPVNGKVEIAYGTFEGYRRMGIGSGVCRMLVELALQTDPSVVVTARTLPEKNYSTRILEKNNFRCLGVVTDPEDGDVWEWEYSNPGT